MAAAAAAARAGGSGSGSGSSSGSGSGSSSLLGSVSSLQLSSAPASANAGFAAPPEQWVKMTDATDADASFERLAGIGEERRVWISFRAKLLAGELPAIAQLTDPAVALFGFTAPQTLAVWDQASQSWREFTAPAKATEWNDYSVYLDYVDQTWKICQNGVIVASGLPFKDKNRIVFSRFKALQSRARAGAASRSSAAVR